MDIKDINKIKVFTDKLKSFNFNTIEIVDNELSTTKFTSNGHVRVIVK